MTDEQIALDMEDLLDSLLACKLTPKQAVGAILAALAAARKDERERCAKVCDELAASLKQDCEATYTTDDSTAAYCAEAIRALKEGRE